MVYWFFKFKNQELGFIICIRLTQAEEKLNLGPLRYFLFDRYGHPHKWVRWISGGSEFDLYNQDEKLFMIIDYHEKFLFMYISKDDSQITRVNAWDQLDLPSLVHPHEVHDFHSHSGELNFFELSFAVYFMLFWEWVRAALGIILA